MLTIRLSRVGKKNKPMYRLIISEKARDPYGRALEILGSYNPHTKEIQAKNERIKYWLSKGSQMSPTVNNLLIEKGIIEGEKVKASKARKKKKSKDQSAGKAEETKESASESEETEAPSENKERDKTEKAPKEESTPKEAEKAPEQKSSAELLKEEKQSEKSEDK